MAVLLGSSEKDYRFALVNTSENFVETEVEAPWVVTIMPSGLCDGSVRADRPSIPALPAHRDNLSLLLFNIVPATGVTVTAFFTR